MAFLVFEQQVLGALVLTVYKVANFGVDCFGCLFGVRLVELVFLVVVITCLSHITAV